MKKRSPMDFAIFSFFLVGTICLGISGILRATKEYWYPKPAALNAEAIGDLIKSQIREKEIVKRIEEKNTVSSEEQKEVAIRTATIKTLGEKIDQALSGMPKAKAAEIQQKALDAAFDDVMNGIGSAVARGLVQKEEERAKQEAGRLASEQMQKEAARIREQTTGAVNSRGKEFFDSACKAIVEVATYTQEKRFGRKIQTDVQPVPDDLFHGQSKPILTIKFDTNTTWKVWFNPGDYDAGKIKSMPSMGIIEHDDTKLGVTDWHANMGIPAAEGRVIEVKTTPSNAAIAGLVAAYVAGNIQSDTDFLAKVAMQLVGMKEVAEALRKEDPSHGRRSP